MGLNASVESVGSTDVAIADHADQSFGYYGNLGFYGRLGARFNLGLDYRTRQLAAGLSRSSGLSADP